MCSTCVECFADLDLCLATHDIPILLLQTLSHTLTHALTQQFLQPIPSSPPPLPVTHAQDTLHTTFFSSSHTHTLSHTHTPLSPTNSLSASVYLSLFHTQHAAHHLPLFIYTLSHTDTDTHTRIASSNRLSRGVLSYLSFPHLTHTAECPQKLFDILAATHYSTLQVIATQCN